MRQTVNFQIENCRIITDEYRLESPDSATTTLQPKFIEVLEYLALNFPRLVSREELITEIWKGNFLVGEQALTNAIWNLRQAFRKCLGEKSIIDTVHKAGYRLLIKPEFDQAIDNKSDRKRLLSFPFQTSLIAFSAILLAISMFLYFKPNSEFSNPVIESVTTDPGRELFPSLSPDSQWLVFKWIRQGHTDDLYLKNLEQPELAFKRLTFSKEEEGAPVWSKDGKQIYYNRVDRSKKTCNVMRVTLKNGQEKVIAPCQYQMFTQISISPDGKRFAYLSPSKNKSPAPIFILDLDDLKKEPQEIYCKQKCDYRNRDLAFSPDNAKLAVTRRVGDYSENIFIINLLNNKTTQITNNFKNIVGIAWHPDNKRVVFGAQDSAFREGYVVNVNTKKIESLGVEGFSFPNFSKNGDFLLYHYRSAKRYIASISLKQSENSTLFPLLLSEFSHRNQSYSKLNKKIVYTSNETGHFELWMSNISGEEREQLTFLEQELETPSWSRDGKKIAFLAPNNEGVGNKIFLLDIETRKITSLESPFKTHGSPSWVADDSSVISSVDDGAKKNLFLFFTNGNPPKAVTISGGVYGQEDSFGKLFFTREDETLWTKSNGEEAKQFFTEGQFSSLYSWGLADKGIFFSQKEEGFSQIVYYDFKTQKFTHLAKLPWLTDDKYVSFSVVEDEQKLLLTVQEYPQANIKLLRHSLLTN